MGMTDKSLCDSCTNIGCEFQSGIVRTKCAFYMPPQLEPDNCGNYVVQDSTTKNDIRDNRVKNELNRVKDELEPTTKNDLGVGLISRADALRVAKNEYLRGWHNALCKALSEKYSIHCEEGNFSVIQEETIIGLGLSMNCALGKDVESYMSTMPSVTPQEPRWIPMVRREPTDEEKAEYLAQNGKELCYMLENEMPLNGEEVLVSIGEFVSEDIFDEDFYNFENNDIENVDAWMPLPEPYKSESEDKE